MRSIRPCLFLFLGLVLMQAGGEAYAADAPQTFSPQELRQDLVELEGLMPYLADKPYRNGSDYVLKIIEGRQKEVQKVGDVVRGTQEVKLSHTQFGLVVPRFLLKRPSGAEGLVQPDILIPDDPFRAATAIEALLRI